MEKYLESLTRQLPILEKQFVEHQDSLNAVMEDFDNKRVQLVHLGEKVI
jgi:hypothetical protein